MFVLCFKIIPAFVLMLLQLDMQQKLTNLLILIRNLRVNCKVLYIFEIRKKGAIKWCQNKRLSLFKKIKLMVVAEKQNVLYQI